MKKYKQVFSGEWVQPVARGYLLACCDCSLVHRINFRIVNRKTQFQAFRQKKETQRLRKIRNKK